jgi:hypothetical protein
MTKRNVVFDEYNKAEKELSELKFVKIPKRIVEKEDFISLCLDFSTKENNLEKCNQCKWRFECWTKK